jgi:hypothetical protein
MIRLTSRIDSRVPEESATELISDAQLSGAYNQKDPYYARPLGS